jgi:hypothetical protein
MLSILMALQAGLPPLDFSGIRGKDLSSLFGLFSRLGPLDTRKVNSFNRG